MLTLYTSPHPGTAAAACLNDLLRNTSAPRLLFFSGGSALNVLSDIDTTLLASEDVALMLDERCTEDPQYSNFLKLQATDFYAKTLERSVSWISSVPQQETKEELAARVSRALEIWMKDKPAVNSIALMGIGEDGHVGSIFPKRTEDAFNEAYGKAPLFVALRNIHAPFVSERISLTPRFMQEHISNAVVYVSGERKREVLRRVMHGDGFIHELPALIFHRMKNVAIYTDLKI